MMLANAYGISRLEQLCARKIATRLDANNVHEVARCASLIGEPYLQRATQKYSALVARQEESQPVSMICAVEPSAMTVV